MEINNIVQSFAFGMIRSSEIISEIKPDFVIAPMMGSVPLIDCMHASDPNFDPGKVHYMPASSHIPDVNNVIKDWMSNFLDANIRPDNHPAKIVTIDEVASGGSATRVNRAVERTIRKKLTALVGEVARKFWATEPKEFAQAAAYFDDLTQHKFHDLMIHLVTNQASGLYQRDLTARTRDCGVLLGTVRKYFENFITHTGIGIEDSKSGIYLKRKRNPEYNELVERKVIVPVGVEVIVTMDHPELCPVRYQGLEVEPKDGHVRSKPLVDKQPVITSAYLDLLKQISALTNGRAMPEPVSVHRAMFSSDYLSTKYGGEYQKK